MNNAYKIYIKRIFDVAFSIILVILLSWLFLLIVLLYALLLRFPILFVQERIGKNEQMFNLVKFRTLEMNGPSIESRRFWLGNFLRFMSLDELPQVVNVLKGEMSIIGPRPLPKEYLPFFNEDQRKRHAVKPGITGWAQVNGRNSIPWNKKFELDIFYINNLTFGLDMKILFKTLLLILYFKKDTSLHEQKFTGNNHA